MDFLKDSRFISIFGLFARRQKNHFISPAKSPGEGVPPPNPPPSPVWRGRFGTPPSVSVKPWARRLIRHLERRTYSRGVVRQHVVNFLNFVPKQPSFAKYFRFCVVCTTFDYDFSPKSPLKLSTERRCVVAKKYLQYEKPTQKNSSGQPQNEMYQNSRIKPRKWAEIIFDTNQTCTSCDKLFRFYCRSRPGFFLEGGGVIALPRPQHWLQYFYLFGAPYLRQEMSFYSVL